MKIEHTTHEASKRGRPTGPLNTSPERVKNYFSSRIRGKTQPKEEDEEPLIRPDQKTEKGRASEANTPNKLKKQQRGVQLADNSRIRAKERDEKLKKESKKFRVSKKTDQLKWRGYGPWPAIRSNEGRPCPSQTLPIETKSSFENLKGGERKTERRDKTQGDLYIEHIRAQRQAMREGKLEKAIPPSYSSEKPKLTPGRQEPSVGRPGHKKTPSTSSILSSTSSKLGSYIGNGADILDATRRDLASNLRKSTGKIIGKFDNLGQYIAGMGNNWDDSSDSDVSFYCIGESQERQESPTDTVRRSSELARARHLSGDGTDPWTDDPLKECRLCHKPSPAGIRGLCWQCEEVFYRPKTLVFADGEEKIKPPSPLKIKKVREVSAHMQVSVGRIPDPFSGENVNGLKVDRVNCNPQIVTPNNCYSHVVHIENSPPPRTGSTLVSQHERWQSPKIRALYQKNEDTRWSPSLLSDEEAFKPLPNLPRNRLKKVGNLSVTDEDTSTLFPSGGGQGNRTREA